jgi:anti-sigma28 factor (negative regulator of flagellin synthesis)
MRVYDTNLTGASAAETGRAQESQKLDRNGPAKSSSPGTVSGGDRVELSGALGRLSKSISSFHQNRANRVEALTARYQSGKYQPDSLATSHAMVSESLSAGPAEAGLK